MFKMSTNRSDWTSTRRSNGLRRFQDNLGETVYSTTNSELRIGAALDVMGDGRTRLHAYYGRS